jgi:hypothetical protein
MKKVSAISLGVLLALTGLGVFWAIREISGRYRLPILGAPGHRTGSFAFSDQEGRLVTDKTVEKQSHGRGIFFDEL